MIQARTYDRRANQLPANARVAVVTVDDPDESGDRLVVLRSLRDDPLGALRSAGQVDEVQYLAGRHWQRAYELAEIGGVRAIDTTRERVDGGQIAQPTVSNAQSRAMDDLSRAAKRLGDYGNSVVFDILARHMTIRECATGRAMTREAEFKFIGRRFRECLDTLAVLFGYATH